MTILQGALSHNAFAFKMPPGTQETTGMFRPVIDKGVVVGPTAVSHTGADWALLGQERLQKKFDIDGSVILMDAASPDVDCRVRNIHATLGRAGADCMKTDEVENLKKFKKKQKHDLVIWLSWSVLHCWTKLDC